MTLKKTLCFLVFGWMSATAFGQFNPQSATIRKKFFPDPQLDISTPAFQKQDGFTNHSEMMNWLETKLKGHENEASLSFIGESQKGKKIPMLVLTKKNNRPKTKVWMQGGLHGDEPAGTESMLFLLDKLLNDASLSYLLEELEIALVPMANIDGYEKQIRQSANGIDLNRDQTSLKAPESVALKRAFNQFNPSVALDFHEYRPYRKDFTRFGSGGVAALYDAMFLYSGNLNVPAGLRSFTQTSFVNNARKALDQNQLRHHDYLTPQKYGGQVQFNLGSIHSRSSATSYALANSVSTLLEIRGVGVGRDAFKRRVKTSYLIALSYLETAFKERMQLAEVLAKSAQTQNPVVVTSDRKSQKDTLSVIDLGTNEEIRLPVVVHNALECTPILERKRPSAYLLLPSERLAVSKLKVLGLQIDSLSKETDLEAEAYDFGKTVSEEDEGQETDEEDNDSPQTEGHTKRITRKFPTGTYVVYLNQQRANLACEVLEPENANGFVANKIIKPKTSEMLPVFRYLKTEKITP